MKGNMSIHMEACYGIIDMLSAYTYINTKKEEIILSFTEEFDITYNKKKKKTWAVGYSYAPNNLGAFKLSTS